MVRFFILNVALAYDKLLGGVEANPLIDQSFPFFYSLDVPRSEEFFYFLLASNYKVHTIVNKVGLAIHGWG